MPNEEHFEILKQGVETWNKWRQENPNVIPDLSMKYWIKSDLSGVDFSRTNLKGAILLIVNLRGANLSGANLEWANLFNANLFEADLSGANLFRTNFNQAILYGANLSEASLMETIFYGTILYEADISGAWIVSTIFGNVDLSKTKGLENVMPGHPVAGASTIGIDTIFKSKGKIPDVFLHNCGVPNELITYLERIKIPEPQFTLNQLNLFIAQLEKQLTIVIRNLGECKISRTLHGPLEVNLKLNNTIDELEKFEGILKAELDGYKRQKALYYPEEEQK